MTHICLPEIGIRAIWLLLPVIAFGLAGPRAHANGHHIAADGHETFGTGVLYEDNLRGPHPSMVHSEGGCQTRFVEDGYLVSALARGCEIEIADDFFSWDIGYAVSTRVVSAGNGYGISWGAAKVDDEDVGGDGYIFFLLRITPDGRFSIIKHLGKRETDLVPSTPNAAIHTGEGALNRLAVVLHNGSIDALINGSHVASVGSGEKLNAGKMRVFAERPDTRVVFSDVRVIGLPTQGQTDHGQANPRRSGSSSEGIGTRRDGRSPNWNPYDSGGQR